jgi:hypothetical protein
MRDFAARCNDAVWRIRVAEQVAYGGALAALSLYGMDIHAGAGWTSDWKAILIAAGGAGLGWMLGRRRSATAAAALFAAVAVGCALPFIYPIRIWYFGIMAALLWTFGQAFRSARWLARLESERENPLDALSGEGDPADRTRAKRDRLQTS